MHNTGRVMFFDPQQGYGFIEHIDGRQVYFHYTAIAREVINKHVSSGMKVYFDLLETTSGWEAANVVVFNGS
ncbi:MAG: cold shock domain-containing protein [Pseudobdellovibrionaceae bacterium]|nr:cold shock domain-containing protein [Bdellovibrionales bacterium]USN47413.1 MAG: cold shock domain-containing protein [Pseudobdellovibrionaceae bacterium]